VKCDSSQMAGTGSARPRFRPLRAAARFTGHVALVACWLLVAVMAALTWGPHLTKYKTDVIVGQSMEPTIPLYSVTIVEDVQPDRLRVGDVIVFEQPEVPGRKVTHRIERIERLKDEALSFVTKGDNNEVRDPWRVTYAGTGYRVREHVPHVGWLMIKAQTRIARVALVVLPVLLLLSQFMRWLWKGDADEAEQDADEDTAGVHWDDWEYVPEVADEARASVRRGVA